jgi:ketosteroid isomerase-like protein
MEIDNQDVLEAVRACFDRYEKALMADDIPAMDRLFHDASTTVRYGVGEVLYGMDEIRAFRRGRGGSPQRVLTKVSIHAFGPDVAVANAEFRREGSERRGRQSQTWVRFPDGWKVVSAHVSLEGSTS